MLDLMRRQSSLIYIIFGAIILLFALNFGPAPSGCAEQTQADWAAKVDGVPIRSHDFSLLYSRQLAYLQQLAERAGQPFDPNMALQYGLPKQVLDQLVERRLLAQQARRAHISVTDAALVHFLREQYEVKQDVSYATYESWVQRAFDTNVARFEDDTRQDIAAQHFATLVRDGVSIGTAELQEEYQRDHDRAEVMFARFDGDEAAQPSPPAAAVNKLLADDFGAVEAYFHAHAADYQLPAQAHVRQIVVKLAPDAAAEDVAAGTQSLQALRAQATQGADFALLARDAASKTQVPHDGDMGFLAYEELAPALADAVRALAPGAVSEPVRSPLGLHLLQVVEKREAHQRALSDHKAEVAAGVLKQREAQRQAAASAQALHHKLQAGATWEQITAAEADEGHGSRPIRYTTASFKRSAAAVPQIGQNAELRAAIFAAEHVGALLPQVYEVTGSYFVVALQDRQRPNMDHFAGEQQALRDEALQTKRNRVMHDLGAYLRSQSTVQLNAAVFGGSQAPS